ncbi:MAG: 3'-5' exonuclease, partial [Nitrososphaerales archaeon]
MPTLQESTDPTKNLAEKLSRLLAPASELDEGLLVSATYDGDKRLAVLKFYDPKLERVWRWEDNTGHKPYCYTKLPLSDLGAVRARKDILSIEDAQRLDLLSDSTITVRKIVAADPLAIGGSAGSSVRDQIEAWEADIKYYENYVYDRGLRMGTYYSIHGGNVAAVEKEMPATVARSLEQILSKNKGEQEKRFNREWAELLGQPLCPFKRIALDIEVANEEGRVPDPEKADRPVIAVSLHNGTESLVYLLAKEGDTSLSGAKTSYVPTVFGDEASLLRATFSKVMDYPFLITFNGDDFDLRYLVHRAEKLGVGEAEIPIYLMRQEASLRHGVHVDLYRFFNNRSIQLYVYSNKYTEHTLNGISESVLGKSKIEFEGNVGDLPLLELANYCLNDSQLTYELTSASSSLMMKMLLVISRIAKMPMNDVARLGVSNWIRSMLFYEHRRMGALIPRQDELKLKGGASSEAIIKGKKYKGGLVIEPTPGVHFGVSVLDFASLYPSIIKVYNLSYETVNCPHEECRTNRVPDTENWVCRKRNGIESLVTGSLRDLRVGHYKHLAKDSSLPREEMELSSVVSQGLKVILNACFTPDTCLVTPRGIKNIKDVVVGDKVVNVNPITLATEIDTVVEVQRFPYDGEMYHFKDRRFVDLAVTPNHRMLVADERSRSDAPAAFLTAEEVYNRTNVAIPKLAGGIEGSVGPERVSLLGTAKELGGVVDVYPRRGARLSTWFRTLPAGLRLKIRQFGSVNKNRSKIDPALRSHYRLPSAVVLEGDIDDIERAGGSVLLGSPKGSKIPARYDGEAFASLCGWFVSEGSLVATEPRRYESGRHRGRSSGIVVTQSFGKGNSVGVPYRSEIKRVMAQLGLRAASDPQDKKHYRVSNGLLHHWMLTNCYSSDSQEHRSHSKRVPDFVFGSRRLIESFFSSCYKGDGSSRDRLYSTTSLRLAQEVVVLQSLLGARTKVVYDQKARRYRVVFGNVSSKLTDAGPARHKFVSRVPYSGTVYCVTTERNHTVLAGRNGRFVPVGQSYGVMGFETFALYCLPVAEATAAYGRYAITRTIDKCKQEGISVIYSDSVTSERCVTLLDPEGLLRIEPMGAFFERFTDLVHRPDGKDEVHPSGWKALALNPTTGDAEWKDVQAAIRHRNTKRVFRVWDKFGSTRVTEDHSLLAREGASIVLARPTELAGRHLLRVPRMPETKRIDSVDVFEALRRVKYPVVYEGRTKTLEAKTDGEWVTFLRTDRERPVRVKRFISVGTPEFRALVELLGAYIAEGSSSTPDSADPKFGASISCSEVEWLQALQADYNLLFDGAKASIIRSSPGQRTPRYQSGRGGVTEVQYEDRTEKLQMMNQLSAVFFKAFCGQKSDGKHLPEFIFHVPDEYKALLVESMVRGDGPRVLGPAHSQEYRSKDFKHETKSLRVAGGFSTLLLQLGVKHTIGYDPRKKTCAITTSSNYDQTVRPPRVLEEPYDGFVYDLTVEGLHTFTDSCGGIVLKNTDSLFVENPDKSKVEELTRWAEHDLGVELDVDKSYRYVAFSERKKNYFGVLADGTADIKGLTGKKSVSGDTPILARIDGKATFTKVEEVYRAFGRGSRVELPTISNELVSTWTGIDDAMAHDVDEVYRVQTGKGRLLKLSGDHSIFFIDRYGRVFCKATRDVQVGDVLVGARFIPDSGMPQTLDVSQMIPNTRERDGLLYSAKAHSTKGTPIKRFIPVTDDLGLLFGLFTAEGSTASNPGSRSSTITQSEAVNPEVCDALKSAWTRTFGWDINPPSDARERASYLPILYAELFESECGAKGPTERAPDFIFSAPKGVVRAYLRGLFSGDGFSGGGKKISVASESRLLMEQTAYLLTYFDIDCRFRTCYNSRFKTTYYQLSIIGISSRRRFQETIGFLQPRFQTVPEDRPRNKELIPLSTEGLIEVKRSILKRLGISRFRHIKMHDARLFNLSLVEEYNQTIDALRRHATPVESGLLSSIRNMIN